MSIDDDGRPWARLEVTPPPSADERDAIVAALSVLFQVRGRPANEAPAATERVSRWKVTARQEAVGDTSP